MGGGGSANSHCRFFEMAANQGKATGAVSTVNFDHATPAAVVANAANRSDCTRGPTAAQFNQVVNNGVGNLPGAVYNSGSHTNILVPFFAKGAGVDLFLQYLVGYDPQMADRQRLPKDAPIRN
jgi:alkaline phosphatase